MHLFIVTELNMKLQTVKKYHRCPTKGNPFKKASLLINCPGSRHRASDCARKTNFHNCGGKHHTSICMKEKLPSQPMCAVTEHNVSYPVVMV